MYLDQQSNFVWEKNTNHLVITRMSDMLSKWLQVWLSNKAVYFEAIARLFMSSGAFKQTAIDYLNKI